MEWTGRLIASGGEVARVWGARWRVGSERRRDREGRGVVFEVDRTGFFCRIVRLRDGSVGSGPLQKRANRW